MKAAERVGPLFAILDRLYLPEDEALDVEGRQHAEPLPADRGSPRQYCEGYNMCVMNCVRFSVAPTARVLHRSSRRASLCRPTVARMSTWHSSTNSSSQMRTRAVLRRNSACLNRQRRYRVMMKSAGTSMANPPRCCSLASCGSPRWRALEVGEGLLPGHADEGGFGGCLMLCVDHMRGQRWEAADRA